MLPTTGSTSPDTNKNRKQQEYGQASPQKLLPLTELNLKTVKDILGILQASQIQELASSPL